MTTSMLVVAATGREVTYVLGRSTDITQASVALYVLAQVVELDFCEAAWRLR
jgi:hypothetical protein